MSTYDYDLFVIGAGSGGVRAARIAAGHGAKVALAEEYRFGGTCVIRGCVPKKLFVYAARFAHEFEDAAGFGWSVGERSFNWKTLVANKDKEIDRLEGLYQGTLARAGVEVFASRAELEDAHTLVLKDGRRISAKTILVATGGTPVLDDKIEGIEHAITSNEAFHLDELPPRIVVVGGGYIAVEFAGIFNGLGVDTTLAYRGEKILRGFDEDMRDGVTTSYKTLGIDVRTETVFERIEKTAAGYVGHLKGGGTVAADLFMFAIGRTPNTKNLGLQAAGVELGWNGHVVVDSNSRSSVDNIYAVGDVADRVQLTPVAIKEGHAFADSLYGGKPWNVNHDTIPTAVFSDPEIGTVGLPEYLARERYPKLDIYKSNFRPMKYTLAGRESRMIMKLLVDGQSDKVVGCHILGPDAAEIVQIVAVAMRMGATKAQFDATMALHPSAAEELVTMREKWTPPEVSA